MADSATSGIPAFPMPRTCPFSPPPQYAEIRAQNPVTRVTLHDGSATWLITNHEYVRAFLSHPETSSDRSRPSFPATVPNTKAFAQKGFLLSMDAPEHSFHRRMVTSAFTLNRVRSLRPRIQQIVDECVDRIARAKVRPVDLVQELSLPVPSLVICELLGVPYESRDTFQKYTEILLSGASTAEDRGGAFMALREFLGDLVTQKDRAPQEDLLSRLVVKYREADAFDHETLTGLAMLLLIAGHETTANMISLGVVALLSHPEQLAAIKEDPSLTPRAVEELLRFFSIVDYPTARVALTDIQLGEVTIRAGEGAIASAAAANHDDEIFGDPDTFNIRRHARGHVAFGYGAHQCLGQNLARAELEIVYDTLFARIPGLRLTRPVTELPFKDATVYGLHRLEVTW